MSSTVDVLKSELLQAEVPFAVILPEGIGPFSVLYDLHGLLNDEGPYDPAPTPRAYFEKQPFRKLQRIANETGVAIVRINGGRGWYLDSPRIQNSQYESHFVRELIPYVETVFPSIGKKKEAATQLLPNIGKEEKAATRLLPGIGSSSGRGISGHSMGGVGAIHFLCRYPELFSVGAIHCASLRFMPPNDHRGSFIEELMSDAELRAAFPDDFLNALLCSKLKLRITVGQDDGERIVRENRRLHEFLLENNQPHIYEETPGGHEYIPHGLNGVIWAAQQLKEQNYDA